MGRVEGKVALVTGAASGIGLASANLLACEGAAVMYADVNLEGARAAAQAARDAGGKAAAVHVDVLDRASIQAAVDETVRQFGGLNILMNNAGGNRPDTDLDALHITEDAWDFALNINVTAALHGCQAALPHLLAGGGGSIINTASMAYRGGDLVRTGYGAGKAAVVSLTRSVAAQFGKHGVRCNAISPGLILTPAAAQHLTPEFRMLFQRHNAVDALGQPDDIGYVALFLASDESRYVTGQNIEVDGGHFVSQPVNADLRDYMAQMQAGQTGQQG